MKSKSKSKRFTILLAVVISVLTLLMAGIVSARSTTANQAAVDRGTVNGETKKEAPSPQVAIDKLKADSNGSVELTMNSATDVVRFASFPQGLSNFALRNVNNAAARKQADSFLTSYGAAFGLRDASTQLAYVDTVVDIYGFTHVNYVEVESGVDVFASTMRVHFNESGQLTAVNGTIIPKIYASAKPKLTPEEAGAIAVAKVTEQQATKATVGQLAVVENTLYFYHTGLVQSIPGITVLVYKVEVSNASNIREFVFVDAQNGSIVEQFSGIHEGVGVDREISETSLANVVWDESNGDPDPIPAGWDGGTVQQVTDWQNEIDGSEETYNTIDNLTGGTYSSYDDAEATMRTVNNDPGINCPNANWNGISTNYCSNVTGDDTVAHEWGHAYTEYTHNLVYAWQPGALNESYSDIWGEIVDFINGRGLDAPLGLRTTGACSTFGDGTPSTDVSYRWLSGEDDPAFGGAIRDMWQPTCYGDPGKVSDTQYFCASTDGGGVHSNSGVPNHAFALLVDGGTYNSQTITGIGLSKAAHIYWRAQTVYQSETSDFSDHASALAQSCTDLVGDPITALSSVYNTSVPTAPITAGDCAELNKVITAVQFHTPPTQCNFEPAFVAAPPLCENQGTGVVNSIYTQTWESGSVGWVIDTHDIANPSSFTNPDWVITSTLPGSQPGNAMFVEDSVGRGACTPSNTNAGALNLDSPVFTVPAGVDITRIAIDQLIATESGWDGGNVKIRVNGGSWTVLPDSVFEVNGYFAPGALNSVGAGNDNPLAGQAAFTGGGAGAVSTGWGQSQLNLSSYVSPGDEFQLRFDMGLDGCNGVDGWYVDDFEVYSCVGEGTAPGDPVIEVNSDNIISSQVIDSQITQTFTISNVGGANLDWTIDEVPGTTFAQILQSAGNHEIDARQAPKVSGRSASSYIASPAAVLLDEGFEGGVIPPTDWTHDIQNAGYTWKINTVNPYNGTYMADVLYDPALSPQDEWLLSPQINLGGGILSFWSEGSIYWCRDTFENCDLDVWLVIGAIGGGDDIYVGNADEDWTASFTWTQSTFDLTSLVPGGPVRIGFQYTGVDGAQIAIDDILLDGDLGGPCATPSDIPWVSVNPISGTVASLSASDVDVVFDSTGMISGIYTGTLCLNSNDPVTPQVTLPLTMTVRDYSYIFLPAILKP